MSEEQSPVPEGSKPPLTILRFLCILTFIGSGLGVISFGSIGVFYDFFVNNIDQIAASQTTDVAKIMLSNSQGFFLLNAVLYFVSLLGSILMWRMQKIGFHLYTSSQLFLLIIPYLFKSDIPTSAFSIFISIAFIATYGMYIKQMN